MADQNQRTDNEPQPRRETAQSGRREQASSRSAGLRRSSQPEETERRRDRAQLMREKNRNRRMR